MHWQLWWEYKRKGCHWTCEEEAVMVDSCQMLADHAEPAAHTLHDAHTCLPAQSDFSQLYCRTNKEMIWVVIWDKALLLPGLKIPPGFGSQCTLALSQVPADVALPAVKNKRWLEINPNCCKSCFAFLSFDPIPRNFLSLQRSKSEKYLALHLQLA